MYMYCNYNQCTKQIIYAGTVHTIRSLHCNYILINYLNRRIEIEDMRLKAKFKFTRMHSLFIEADPELCTYHNGD